jgi:ectoine hydroxylase-related dioxygenase (phytanoyl-CoA dioxygenase family)
MTKSAYELYREKGAAVVRTNSEIDIKELTLVVQQLYDKHKTGSFFYSLLSLPTAECRIISAQITSLFQRCLADTLPGYRFITGSFLCKPANTSNELYLHQDWSYTDEDNFLPVTCWLPLCSTGHNSGGMFLVEGSHTVDKSICSNSYETLRINSEHVDPNIITEINTTLPDILLFHPKTWHGSYANNSNNDRIVLTCMALPENAPFLYYHRLNNTRCRIYKLYDGAFEEHLHKLVKNEIPDSFIHMTDIDYNHQPKISL